MFKKYRVISLPPPPRSVQMLKQKCHYYSTVSNHPIINVLWNEIFLLSTPDLHLYPDDRRARWSALYSPLLFFIPPLSSIHSDPRPGNGDQIAQNVSATLMLYCSSPSPPPLPSKLPYFIIREQKAQKPVARPRLRSHRSLSQSGKHRVDPYHLQSSLQSSV